MNRISPTFPQIMKRLLFSTIFAVFATVCTASTPGDSTVHVRLSTTMGDIVVALYNDTPKHRDNFVKLVNEGFYNGLLFHRVIENFMIQGGDPDSRNAAPQKPLGEGGPGYTLPHEIVYPRHWHKRGALAAAREGDDVNPEMRSSGSQFYIVWGKPQSEQTMQDMKERMREVTDGGFEIPDDIVECYETIGGTPHLDGSYTVFGEVTEGLKLVKAIQSVVTDKNDRPRKDIKIIKAEVLKQNREKPASVSR